MPYIYKIILEIYKNYDPFFLRLDENNRPMMLPNGFVYGYGALAKMAQENDGQIVCPRTKEIYPIAEVEKVFVM